MKNTRLFYTDEKNLEIYKALPPQDFKEIFMKMLTYKLGDKVNINEFSNPMNYALFLSFKDKIDFNEVKWENRAKASKENGKKGGRPKKQTIPNEGNTSDLSIYTSTDDKDITLIEEKVTESQKTTKNKTKSSDWVKDNYNRLNEIKTNLNSSLSVQRRIAETNLNDLLNSQIGETYKEEIKSFVYS